MKRIALGLILALLWGGNVYAEEQYQKLIENCADSKSRKSVSSELESKKKLLKEASKLKTYTGGHKRHIKIYENFYDMNFDEKKSWQVYYPSIHECEQDFEENPVKFKIRWE
jgi:hypothetical protein